MILEYLPNGSVARLYAWKTGYGGRWIVKHHYAFSPVCYALLHKECATPFRWSAPTS